MATLTKLLLLIIITTSTIKAQQQPDLITKTFGFPFNQTYYTIFNVQPTATIATDALQITPDSTGNFSLTNRSGRVMFNTPFTLWKPNKTSPNQTQLASFNTSFIVNIFRRNISLNSPPGEGVAFIIAPNSLTQPDNSHGQYLGLTNATIDGERSNKLVAIEFDTFKNDPFDPDDNHVGLNINSVKSNKTVSLSRLGITLAPARTMYHKVWIEYDGGTNKSLSVYITELDSNMFSDAPKSDAPVMYVEDLDLSDVINSESYFGFSGSTGAIATELHCVVSWNLTVENIGNPSEGNNNHMGVYLGVGLSLGVGILVILGVIGWVWWVKRCGQGSDPNILGALKNLPGMPREFEYKDIKKATNNFDEKNKLGQGGYGVVYKGLLPVENDEIAVKKFSRDEIKSKDDFLAELTIINKLRHRNLVKLLGWCHKSRMLLLVYEYLPNGSLDKHIFCRDDKEALCWNLRFKAIKGVASALHYLHNEFEEKVIHRDLKPSNVMLDNNFNARLGDFGLARAVDHEKTSYAENEGVHGTMGYIAPECFHTGKATRESDVYGFGATLLEVACGLRPWVKRDGYQCLVDWVWSKHREGSILDAIDQRLEKNYIGEEGERVLLLGLACCHPIASERPKTQTFLQILTRLVPAPQVPPFKPAFVWPSKGPMDGTTTETVDMTPTSEYDHSGWSPNSVSPHSGYTYNSLV